VIEPVDPNVVKAVSMTARGKDRKQQQRSIDMRGRLLDGALECLIERGYSNTTTTAMCETSGVSRGGQQHHFPTKEKMVIGAVEHLTERIVESIRAEAAQIDEKADPVEAALILLWKGFSGKWFTAAYELWVAARTDEVLRAHFIPAEERAGWAILKVCLDVFPPEITRLDNFPQNLQCVITMLHGLALMQITGLDPKRERYTLAVCGEILRGQADPSGYSE